MRARTVPTFLDEDNVDDGSADAGTGRMPA
jgi:hypothetical protein